MAQPGVQHPEPQVLPQPLPRHALHLPRRGAQQQQGVAHYVGSSSS